MSDPTEPTGPADLPAAYPAVAEHLDDRVLTVLHRVLVHQWDEPTARTVLTGFNTALRGAGSGDPEFDAEVAAGRERMRAVLAELATTTGLRWRSWTGRSYVVTLDGEHIGYVQPARTVSSHHGTRVAEWRPALCVSTTELETTRTVEAAARAVEAAHRARQTGTAR